MRREKSCPIAPFFPRLSFQPLENVVASVDLSGPIQILWLSLSQTYELSQMSNRLPLSRRPLHLKRLHMFMFPVGEGPFLTALWPIPGLVWLSLFAHCGDWRPLLNAFSMWGLFCSLHPAVCMWEERQDTRRWSVCPLSMPI